MDKKIILAVAGSGKTYTLCNSINPNERNLILAFTHQNLKNITSELVKKFKEIPHSTKIWTFDSFVYNNFILPFEPTIVSSFGKEEFHSNGITLNEPPESDWVRNNLRKKSKSNYNKYYKKDELFHYIDPNTKCYYNKTTSELAIYCKKLIIERALKRLQKFFDNIYIDEFQDFRKFDYDLICEISKSFTSVLLVGDYYQHSVIGDKNSGRPYKNSNKDIISYEEFKLNLEKLGFFVDTTSLNKSRRCSKEICQFVKENLNINIDSEGKNDGKVIYVKEEDACKILNDDSIIKLTYKKSNTYPFKARNWSYSKGDTYKNVCVILTKTVTDKNTQKLKLKDNEESIVKNMLYVALTRTAGDLYIMTQSTLEKYLEKIAI